MTKRNAVKIAIDVAMLVVLVLLMATALVQEMPHEWLGVSLFVLVTAHFVMNRRWMAAIPHARLNALRAVQLTALVGLIACILGLMVSSLIISKHAFAFLPVIPGVAWARRVHMICSYWMFVLAFVHAGLHARLPKAKEPSRMWAARAVFAAVACYGVYSFVQLDMWSYLCGLVYFAAVDYSAPLARTVARYASVGVLTGGLFHYIQLALPTRARHKRKDDHLH